MNTKVKIEFGPDKSQILRGIAIIFMITLHNDTSGLFKICVPIFTFLVGYGYAFAKERDLRHGLKRIWHLLSHFWLILLGICLPVGILTGGYVPTLSGVFEEMLGIDSQLNWYSWYVYFYIFAMVAMIPASRIIRRYKIVGTLSLIAACFACVFAIHLIPGWSDNKWIQAAHDCFLCSPVMFSGFYLAEGGGITRIPLKKGCMTAVICIAIMSAIFFVRGIKCVSFIDFVTVPLFCGAAVALFNIITWNPIQRTLISLGKQSMNMWFLHALFATACTATVFAPLIMWISLKALLIIAMITVSFLGSKLTSSVYSSLNR